MNGKKVVDILLVEDDPGDVELTREGLAAGKLLVNMQTVDDGIKALSYLRREAPYSDAVRPDIILLDLNMPRMDGRETLKAIKADPQLRSIPVVVLTTSAEDSDVAAAYQLGVNSYIVKPVDFEKFMEVAEQIEIYWCALNRLPG